MAIENVNAILQAFQHSLATKQQRDQFLQEIELRRQDRELREKEFKAQQEQQKVANEAAAKMFQLHKAESDRAQAQFEYNQALGSMQTNITPPGVQMIPGVQPTANQPLVHSEVAQNQLVFPSGHTIATPTHQQYLGMLAEQQEAANRPKLAAEIAMENLRSQHELQRATALRQTNFQDQIAIMGMQQTFQDEQRRKQEAFQTAQQNARLANTMAVAKLKTMGGLTGFGGTVSYDDEGNAVFMPNNPSDIVNAVRDKIRTGDMTQEELKTRFPVSKPAGQIINADLQENDIKPLTKKQLDDLRELEKVASLVDKIKQLADIRKDHPFLLQMPMGPIVDKWNSLQEQIKGDLAGVSKWLNSVPRFTNVELSKVQDALLPSSDWIHHGAAEEYKKYYKFVEDIQNSFNTILSDVSEPQRAAIRAKMNLDKFPFIGNAIKAPGAPVPRIGGAVQPSERTGGQPQVITVIEKATGRKGQIGINKYNADKDKYQVVP